MNYNKVILVGRLVREPETVMLPSGTQVANLVLAYNRNYKTPEGEWREEVHFFEIKVFGRLAETVIPRLGRGDLILVEGRLHQDKWIDKQTGSPRSKIRIVASDIKLMSRAGVSRPQTTAEQPMAEEGIDLPPFEGEEPPPPKVEETKEEPPLEELDDLEKLLFGEEEEKKPEGGKKDKTDDIDDFDILL